MKTELLKHKFICLVEDHYNPLGIIRSLGEKGIRPIVLLCNPKPHLVNKCRYIEELYKFNTILEGFNFLIKNYKNNKYPPFIYSCSDNVALLLDQNYELLKDHFFFFNGKGKLASLMQKHNLNVLAKECGFNVPKEEILGKENNSTSLDYPVFTKAVTSSKGDDWKSQSCICYSPEKLKETISHIDAEFVLVQEYIEKENEISLEGYSINGGEQIFIPYEGRYYRLSDSSFGHYLYFYPFNNIDLLKKCKEIINKAHYSGVFSIDLLLGKDSKLYFLEINFRNSAWSYAMTYGNCNLPYMWACSTIKNEIKYQFNAKPLINVMAEIDDLRGSVIQSQQISIKEWIMNVKKTNVFMIFNKKDMSPFWAEILFQLKHQVKKRIFRV